MCNFLDIYWTYNITKESPYPQPMYAIYLVIYSIHMQCIMLPLRIKLQKLNVPYFFIMWIKSHLACNFLTTFHAIINKLQCIYYIENLLQWIVFPHCYTSCTNNHNQLIQLSDHLIHDQMWHVFTSHVILQSAIWTALAIYIRQASTSQLCW